MPATQRLHLIPAVDTPRPAWQDPLVVPILSVIALVLAVVGILRLLRGEIGLGLLLLVLACVVGPGGWSVFR